MNVGVPQGSNLGPLLFLIYVNDLPKLKLKGKPRLFADDTSLSYSASHPDEIVDRMTDDLKILCGYFEENLLSLNLTKTKYQIFHRTGHELPPTRQLVVNSSTIDRVTSFKYLGLTRI